MFINLHRTVKKIGENLPQDGRITFGMLEKAYKLTLRLRSQLLGTMYNRIDFGSAPRRIVGEVLASQTDSVVCLMIPEPLPGLKELTAAVEDHWVRMIHEAIAQQSKNGIPYFEKAHVHIRITAPYGTHNHKVWDTSNRAINVIINNLKGIFFDDDNFEHMSCSIAAEWGEMGMTEVRICNHNELQKCYIFR